MQVKSVAVLAVCPLFAALMMAQQPQAQTTTTTTTTTWNGTLLDAGCRATHTETKETKADESGTKRSANTRQSRCAFSARQTAIRSSWSLLNKDLTILSCVICSPWSTFGQ